MELKLRQSVEDKWQSLSKQDQAQHILENSELWNLTKNHRLVTAEVANMNENVSEDFHVRIPNHYYIDK